MLQYLLSSLSLISVRPGDRKRAVNQERAQVGCAPMGWHYHRRLIRMRRSGTALLRSGPCKHPGGLGVYSARIVMQANSYRMYLAKNARKNFRKRRSMQNLRTTNTLHQKDKFRYTSTKVLITSALVLACGFGVNIMLSKYGQSHVLMSQV